MSGPSDTELAAYVQGRLSPDARTRMEAHLDRCPQDREVVAKFVRIFESDPPTRPLSSPSTASTEPDPPLEPAKLEHRGRYLTIHELGRGGMGVVHRAYDPKLQREVALKCIRSDHASVETGDRLLREAQAMAQLNHRNVVAVYDVEVANDELTLVMEFVEGVHLGQWLRAERRSWREVVEVFRRAGQGLATAHRAGLLHRDFKPANVLMSTDGEIKVTDFGIAWMDGAPGQGDEPTPSWPGEPPRTSSAASRLTRDGHVVGTPLYMPPEQYEGRELTSATDQYAFCVSLWEGLTGEPPFIISHDQPEIQVMMASKLKGPPSWPARASEVPRRVQRAIARGLSPEPADRWPTMADLLTELAHDPRRWRRRSLAVGAVVAVVAGGQGWTAYQRAAAMAACEREGAAIEATWNRSRAAGIAREFSRAGGEHATHAWERASSRMEAFAQQWQHASNEVCVEGEVDGTMPPARLARARSCLGEQRASAQALIEQWEQPDNTVIDQAVVATWRLPRVQRCRNAVELGRRPAITDDAEQRRRTQSVLEAIAAASTVARTGKCEQARERITPVLEEALELGHPGLIPKAQRVLGYAQQCDGQFGDAERSYRSAFRRAEIEGDDLEALTAANHLVYTTGRYQARYDEALQWAWIAEILYQRMQLQPDDPLVADALSQKATVLHRMGSFDEALETFERARRIWTQQLGPQSTRVGKVLQNIGSVRLSQGDPKAARAAYTQGLAITEATLGPEHITVATQLNNLGLAYKQLEQFDEALAVYQRALTIQEARLPPGHADTALTLTNLGNIYAIRGEHETGLAYQRRSLAALEDALGPDNPEVANSLNNLGVVLANMGDDQQALRTHQRALGIRERAFAPGHPDIAESLNNIGFASLALGDPSGSLDAHRRALEIRRAHYGPQSLAVASSHHEMGKALTELHRHREALASHREALTLLDEGLVPAGNPILANVLLPLGRSLRANEQPAAAIAPLERALKIRIDADESVARQAVIRFELAQALWDGGGDRDQARALARQAVTGFGGEAHAERLARVRAWLGSRSRSHP
ncbi:MAG: tetratricopeptide repeat protein [Deltaproteobacteria bacterium]|nr:tetratricopeptide repeat protein [Deltaproteobacteria bacterium]